MTTLPPIRYRTFVAAPLAEVFAGLATGDGWCGWFTSAARIDPWAGGSYRFEWRAFGADRVDVTLEGSVVQYEENQAFAFEWDSGAGRTTVAFDVQPRGGGCVVEVTERGYPNSLHGIQRALDCACGWGEALTLLKFHLEHGVRYGAVPPADTAAPG